MDNYVIHIIPRYFFKNKYKDDLTIMWAFEAPRSQFIAITPVLVPGEGCWRFTLRFDFYFISRLRNFPRYVNIIIDRRKDRKVRSKREKIVFSDFLLLLFYNSWWKDKVRKREGEQQEIVRRRSSTS